MTDKEIRNNLLDEGKLNHEAIEKLLTIYKELTR